MQKVQHLNTVTVDNKFAPCIRTSVKLVHKMSRGGGGGHSLVSSVPMRNQKNDEKGYFFQEGQCAALTSFRVGKILQFC